MNKRTKNLNRLINNIADKRKKSPLKMMKEMMMKGHKYLKRLIRLTKVKVLKFRIKLMNIIMNKYQLIINSKNTKSSFLILIIIRLLNQSIIINQSK